MHAKLFVELGVEAHIDSAERQPRGKRGIVVHRYERATS
jgi:hypothetical protein